MYYLFKTDFYEITSSLWVPRCNGLWLTGPTQVNLHCFQCTVNNGYSEHDYNEMQLQQRISIPCYFTTCCKLDGYSELRL